MKISIIIPVLNEIDTIGHLLGDLQALRQRGHEVILADGGSEDGTVQCAAGLVDQVVQTTPGRARQMNAGAEQAQGDMFWFLHADSVIPPQADKQVAACTAGGWGRFDVRLSGNHLLLRIVERLMNLRSRLSGIATGDQGIFVSRALYETVGGLPVLPLMEDIEFSKRLKKIVSPHCLRAQLTTSSRRWETRGIIRTIVLMWLLRAAYAVGIPARRLATYYA